MLPLFLLLFFGTGFVSGASAAQQFSPNCFFTQCGQLSDDGNRVIFPFQDILRDVPTEEPYQIYEWANGQIKPIVKFPADNPNNQNQAELKGISRDGERIFFGTPGKLVPQDLNGAYDVYEITDGNVSIRTDAADQMGRFNNNNSYVSNSPDGEDLFTRTNSFTSANYCSSIFRLNSTGSEEVAGGDLWTPFMQSEPNCESPSYAGVSGDGEHVYYHLKDTEPVYALDMVLQEQPGCQLIHEATDSGSRVVSNFHPPLEQNEICGGYEFGDASYDGSSILFSTPEPLNPADTDARSDMYVATPEGLPKLVSAGPKLAPSLVPPYDSERPLAISSDGSRAVFVTSHPLDPADRDQAQDIYATDVGGNPRLLSTGSVDSHENVRIPTTHGFSQWLVDVSDDARTVAFETEQRLTADDTDDSSDVYISSDGQTRLVSITAFAGNSQTKARMVGLSGSGNSVAYLTRERMTENDLDKSETDYFLRTFDSTEASVSSGRSANRESARKRSRTRLISEETSPPRMKLGKRMKIAGKSSVAVRITCPKAEVNGPCAGQVTVTHSQRKTIRGKKMFQIPTGKSRKLVLKVNRLGNLPKGSGPDRRFFLRIKARDQVGNRSSDVKVRRISAP